MKAPPLQQAEAWGRGASREEHALSQRAAPLAQWSGERACNSAPPNRLLTPSQASLHGQQSCIRLPFQEGEQGAGAGRKQEACAHRR